MNTLGNLGGAISPIMVGYSVELWGAWSTPLMIAAAVYVLGGVLAMLVDPHRRLVFRRAHLPLEMRQSQLNQ